MVGCGQNRILCSMARFYACVKIMIHLEDNKKQSSLMNRATLSAVRFRILQKGGHAFTVNSNFLAFTYEKSVDIIKLKDVGTTIEMLH